MAEQHSESEEKASTNENVPEVQRERRDNSTVFESSSEDHSENDSSLESSSVPSNSKEV